MLHELWNEYNKGNTVKRHHENLGISVDSSQDNTRNTEVLKFYEVNFTLW